MSGARGPPSRSAARGHAANDAYMAEWATAAEQMAAQRTRSGSSAASGSAAASRSAPSAGALARTASGRLDAVARVGGGVRGVTLGDSGGGGSNPVAQDVEALPSAWRPHRQWWSGPLDPAGMLLDLSDRPVMCAAGFMPPAPAAATAAAGSTAPVGAEVVLGCSDHAAYVIDVKKKAKKSTLYSKRAGHTEWVTSATYLGDASGRIATCAMDGKICVWDNKGGRAEPRCVDLLGHFGSISVVCSPGSDQGVHTSPHPYGSLLFSAGYDKTVRVWDTHRATQLAELKGHRAPVMQLTVQPQPLTLARASSRHEDGACAADAASLAPASLLLASGDRDGEVRLWDAHAGAPVGTLTGHRGHVTAMSWMPAVDATTGATISPVRDALLLTGAQDGHLRVWDVRARAPAANLELHTTDKGAGAVGDIAVMHCQPAGAALTGGSARDDAECAYQTYVVTCGADRTVCVTDPRAGFEPVHRFTQHRDFVYSLRTVGPLILSGAGDGLLLAHDARTGKTLWGLGANEAAVRTINVMHDTLVVSGDDGNVLLYDMAPVR